MDYQEINSKTIDLWCNSGWEWGKAISHEEYAKALKGEWDVYLTPTKVVPHAWFGEMKGKRILGLASGGGQQIPVFSALGAKCTVLDYSSCQCESEKMVSPMICPRSWTDRIIMGSLPSPGCTDI